MSKMISPFFTFSGTISREAERRISVEGTKLAMQLGLNEGAERRVVGRWSVEHYLTRKTIGKAEENHGKMGVSMGSS